MGTFLISGSEMEPNLNIKLAITIFWQLGIMVKKICCLLTSRKRVMMSTQLMSRLSPCSASTLSPTSQIISLCGVLLHQKVKG